MSMDFLDTLLTAELVFSGSIDFVFNESYVLVKSLDFN